MYFDKLSAIPAHTKKDDGYYYDEKYVNKIFQINDQLVYFTDKTYRELPLKIVENVIQSIHNDFDQKIQEIRDSNKIMFDKFFEAIDNLSNKLDELSGEKSDPEFSEEVINELIDKKLTDVYNKFQIITAKLSKDAVSEALKDSKRDQVGKLKISSLAMLKDLDYKPEDIKILAEAGLI